LDHTQIPTAFTILNNLLRQIDDLPASTHFPTWLARLGNFEYNITGFPAVADADSGFVQALNRQVFTKAAIRHIRQTQMQPPVNVVVRRVGEYGFVNSAVVFAVSLLVAVDSSIRYGDAVVDWCLKKSGLPRARFPIAWTFLHVRDRPANLDGNNRGHASASG